MERREFLKSATAAGVAAVASASSVAQTPSSGRTTSPVTRPQSPTMIYRELGTTGEKVSAIGMGGFHLAKDQNASADDMVKLVHQAMDRGITFFDNSWDYNDGISEVRLGRALKGRRDKVFVMTKIDGRDKKSYTKQLEESMGRLGVDHVDLVQFHEIIRMEDPDRIFNDDGAIHAAMEARQAGKIRYIGFTGHKDPAIHLRMFEMAAKHNFHFDTVQMPVNVMDAHFRSFTKEVIPVAQKAGTGVLAMKTFGDDFVLQSNTVQPMECLHYGLSQPVSVVITGIDKPAILEQALEAARTWKPMSETEQASLLARTRDAALTGKFEPFKTSQHFDSTATNPKWLGGTNS